MMYDVGNLGPGTAQTCGGVKPINEITSSPLLRIGSRMTIHIHA
jgi:hypothetical protein